MKKYLASLVLLLSISVNCFSLTLDQMLTEVRIKIGDAKTDVNNQRLSSSTLTTRINTVQEYICKETLCIQARISTRTVAEQSEYTFNADVVAPFRIAYYITSSNPPAYKRLEFYTLTTLDKDLSEWENLDSDLPTRYYLRGKKYGLVTKPKAVYVSTYAVQIDYYKKPDELTTGSDVPFDNETLLYTYHDLIVKGVVILCKEDERVAVNDLKTEYYALIQKIKADITSFKDTGIWK
jgi:hypothetical protein